MTDLQLYSTSIVYVNSSILTEEYEVSLEMLGETTPIITVGTGYAGNASGPQQAIVTITNAVPSVGFEFDPLRFMIATQELNFNIVTGGRLLSFSGFIESSNFASAVNTSSRLSFRGRGKLTGWK